MLEQQQAAKKSSGWDDLSTEEKIERMRDLSRQVQILERHYHVEGEVVIKLCDASYINSAKSESGRPGFVYF